MRIDEIVDTTDGKSFYESFANSEAEIWHKIYNTILAKTESFKIDCSKLFSYDEISMYIVSCEQTLIELQDDPREFTNTIQILTELIEYFRK